MPPKVLVATFSAVPAPDRHGVFVDNVISALSVRYELDVLSLRLGDLPYVDRYRRARMLRVPLAEGDMADQVEAFRRAVKRQLVSNDYDVIHLRSAWAALPVCNMRRDLDASVILDLTLSPAAQVRAADRAIVARTLSEESICLDSVDFVIVGSQEARAYLAARRPALQVAVVPPGVDVDTFDWEPLPRAARPILLYVGSIGPGRGIRMLLSALRFILEEDDVELVLTGPVEEGFLPVLDEALVRLGLTKHVALTGPVDHEDVPRIISAASVCLVPTVPDPSRSPMGMCPLKLLEYLACRRPTVAPASASIQQFFSGAFSRFLFDPRTPEDLARAVSYALRNPEEASEAAEAGYRMIREGWTASASRRALLDVYRRFAPEAAPVPAAVPVMSGVLPADPKTTTARRFAALHDTMVQAGAPSNVSGVPVSGETDPQRDTQPLAVLAVEHPDLLASPGNPAKAVATEGEGGADANELGGSHVAVESQEGSDLIEGPVRAGDDTSRLQTGEAPGAADGGRMDPEGDSVSTRRDREGEDRSLNDQDTVKLPLNVVSGTISGSSSGPGSPDGVS